MRLDAEKEKREREEYNTRVRETIKATVKSTKEIIPGVDINEEDKKDLLKMMTVPITFINKNGEKVPMSTAMALRAKNPVLFELKLAYFIKNGFFDEKPKEGVFNILTKKLETSATKRLSDILNSEKKSTGKPATEVDKEKQSKEKTDFIFPQQFVKV
jgi:hypothetical protein